MSDTSGCEYPLNHPSTLGKFFNFMSLCFLDCKIVFNNTYVMWFSWELCNVVGAWKTLDKWWQCAYKLGSRRRELNTEQDLDTLTVLCPLLSVLLTSSQQQSFLMLVPALCVFITSLYLIYLLKICFHFGHCTYDPWVYIVFTTWWLNLRK